METRSLPELLAPAGSVDALKAAVNAGADAVYLSGKSFGARYYADNFDEFQMEKALEYAHLRNKKVYITVNTLVFDYELEKVADYLFWLYKTGADAVILQDIGVASVCRDLVPDLDMHASTQMTINSLEGVEWAHDFGFKRVVLAREMTLPEVEEIAQVMGNRIELEIFAHGALCYCYSGQCLLSSVIGGRSGNRGRCAQPCRKPYQLLQGNKDKYGKLTHPAAISTEANYLLSTRDLALYPKLDVISTIPLNSLKIEGRMRSPEYVSSVVSIYRKALDDLSKGNWTPDITEISKLKLAFNRGFTRGYLLETNKESVMGREAPGNRGLCLGKVVPDKNDKLNNNILIEIDPDLPDFILDKGDGVVFLLPDTSGKYGMALENDPQYLNPHKLLLKTKKWIPSGSEVYLTRDISLSREARNIIGAEGPAISLDITMKWDRKKTPILEGKFTGPNNKEYYLEYKADFTMQTAKKRPISKEQIIDQLKKTGGTPFIIKDVELKYPGNLFIPLSKINRFRREFINKAELELINANRPPMKFIESAKNRLVKIKQELGSGSLTMSGKTTPADEQETKLESNGDKNNSTKKEGQVNSKINPNMDIAIYTSSLEALQGALKGGCKRIYFEPFLWEQFDRELPCEVIDWATHTPKIQELILDAHELCTSRGSTLIWKWPSIIQNNLFKYLREIVNPLYDKGLMEIMIGNMGALKAINRLNTPMKISGSASLNIWNHRTVGEFSKDINRLNLSNELSKEELTSIVHKEYNRDIPFEYVVQGNLESLISEDCLLSGAFNTGQNLKPPWGIEDKKKRIFPIIIDDHARTHILNSVELCLIDYIPDLYQIGFQDLIIDARTKTSAYAKSMVASYRKGLEFKEKTHDSIEKLNKLKFKIKKISQGGITTGNFLNSPE